MTEYHHQGIRSSVVNKSYRCIKAKCNRSLPWNHSTSYSNGLCEQHFFSIDLPSSDDDDDDDDTNSNNNLIDELKILSNKKCIYSTNNQYQPLRGDIRNTREIFDGHQWCLIEQKIDYISSTSNSHFDLFTTKINNEENSFQILRLLSNYQIIQDELKKRQKNS
ncbi:unnamed protein product [Rotaria magnacalcarata]|uniref:Uncharacterized protein n=1 Tax=Rotaria magnacalcarata TaxID=392030 RepID=A0A816YKQ7_9BILA|nr:unnamed protein product [Rotaria magnacalcarata]CAF1394883.1 unnamed protein product [Rotaria magnacalcarata]CAF2111512.1 unnamed protein product [Rotaria magnacalcarata]CAF2157923.1 unnamed protein product [Rotaria magnacalcarata]CAF3793130.1 unnamed protein product [Rotaria magnacalcarata]